MGSGEEETGCDRNEEVVREIKMVKEAGEYQETKLILNVVKTEEEIVLQPVSLQFVTPLLLLSHTSVQNTCIAYWHLNMTVLVLYLQQE